MAPIWVTNRSKPNHKSNNPKCYILSSVEDNYLKLTIQFHKLQTMGEIPLSGVTLVYSRQSDDTQLPGIIPDLGSCQDYDYENLLKSNHAQSTT